MRRLVCIFNILFIYLIMLFPLFIFFGSKISTLDNIWNNLFNNNVFIPLALIIIFYFISLILNIIYCVKTINSNIELNDLIKSNRTVKLIQMPAYIIIFILGVICILAILTIPFAFVLAFFSFASLLMSGIYAVTCYKKLKDKAIISNKSFILYSLLSFVYIADLFVAIIVYKKYYKLRR